MKSLFSFFILVSLAGTVAVSQNDKRPSSASARVVPVAAVSAAKEQPAKDKAEVAVQVSEGYVIGPEDVLSIVVQKEPDLSSKVFVRPDGMISLPQLNDVQAAGATPMELQQRITEGLSRILTLPQVSVLVLEIRSSVIYVHGQVKSPGVYPLGRPLTVMELLVKAGGLSEYAKDEEIQIVRNEGGKTVRHIFNFKHFLEGKDYKQNIALRSGDMVIIP